MLILGKGKEGWQRWSGVSRLVCRMDKGYDRDQQQSNRKVRKGE
jgi:hypothetical protein